MVDLAPALFFKFKLPLLLSGEERLKFTPVEDASSLQSVTDR